LFMKKTTERTRSDIVGSAVIADGLGSNSVFGRVKTSDITLNKYSRVSRLIGTPADWKAWMNSGS
jgi:hypothetical protein